MTLRTLSKQLQRTKKDILKMSKALGMVENTTDEHALEYVFFSYKNFIDLQFEFNMRKVDYVNRVRDILNQYPFCTKELITKKLHRPSSYTVWILTEMSFTEADLAETDDDLLFLVNKKTEKMLDTNKIPVYNVDTI